MTSSSNLVLEYKLVARFESLQKALLDDQHRDRSHTPLAHWALPKDRRLPRAFLGRTIKELIDTPFESLYATPGVGQKKIAALLDLLERAASATPPGMSESAPAQCAAHLDVADGCAPSDSAVTDPANISEMAWNRLREAVVAAGLAGEPLGRFVPSLAELPRVIWSTPLESYARLSLAEIRSLRTHGEKRVRGVLEVFAALSAVATTAANYTHLGVRAQPRFALDVERWSQRALASSGVTLAELDAGLIRPMISQIRADAGDQVSELAESRLGLRDPGDSVRQAARRMGLTRARIYQLLDDVAAIFRVRWPEGRLLLARVEERLRFAGDVDAYELLKSSQELFYPTKTRDHASSNGSAMRTYRAPIDRPSTPSIRRDRMTLGV